MSYLLYLRIMNTMKLRFILFPLCALLLGTVAAPSLALLHDLKIELVGMEDFSEEESSVFEHECFEKEMVFNPADKQEHIFYLLKRAAGDCKHVYQADHFTDIFLPPPEILS